MTRNLNHKIQLDFEQAAGLLTHDLVWSEDFESIRRPLAAFIASKAQLGAANDVTLIKLVGALLSTENDFTI